MEKQDRNFVSVVVGVPAHVPVEEEQQNWAMLAREEMKLEPHCTLEVVLKPP